MVERLTSTSTNETLLKYTNNNLFKFNDLTIKLASGNKYNTISENPTASVNILNTNRQINQIGVFKGNISLANSSLGNQDSILSLAEKYAQRARDLGMQAATGTYDTSALEGIKADIDELINTIVDIGNNQYNGNYTFAGSRVKTVPYTVEKDEEGNITVNYNGSKATDNYQKKTEIADGVFETINVTGDQVFGYYEKVQSTNAQGGKLFKDASDREVVYDEAQDKYFYTSDGSEYTGKVKDLKKEYNQAEDASGNKQFEAADGAYVYYDGSNYFYENGDAYTGDVSELNKVYEYKSSGTFGAICELSADLGRAIKAMKSGNSDAKEAAEQGIRSSLDKFSAGINNISTVQTKFGGIANRLEMTNNTLENNELQLTEYLSGIKDLDFTSAITDWMNAQYAYEASLKAMSQSMNTSLLNYM
ncbi:flagellar hook-associated protein FlgL [bacterium]|nr:flagellar hook-associated protein FlgL [bacterium]